MVGNVHPCGQLRNFDSPLPLVFDIDDPSENGCNFIGFVFVFPIEAFVVAQPLDAQQRVEFADVVVLKVEGVKHVGFYEFLHFLDLALLMENLQFVPVLHSQDGVETVFGQVEVPIWRLCEFDVL